MTCSRSIRWVGLALATCVLTAPLASGESAKLDDHGFIAAQPEDMQPPEGKNQFVIFGDPTKPGLYVVRSTFRAGRFSQPHFHNQDRHVTIIKGTWWVSLGPDADAGDRSKMVPMKTGSYVFHPANGHHFDGAKDEDAVVQIVGMGPVFSTPVKAEGSTAPR